MVEREISKPGPVSALALESLARRIRLWRSRLRAATWRARGSRLGKRNSIGPGCRIERPWCLATGNRVSLEGGVYLKAVADEARLVLDDFVFVGMGVEIDVSTAVRIGEHSLLAPGCFITDHVHRTAAGALIDSQGCEARQVNIGRDVWLGARCIVLPGVTIGDGAVVGAGAVVTADVPAGTVAAGVPARVLRER